MKTSSHKKFLISIIVLLFVLLTVAITTTVAYLTSRRNVTGYINFATGISIDYKNVNATSNSTSVGNILYFDDENLDSNIDNGELKNLELTNVMPGKIIQIANPKLSPKQDTASFALRAKLVITDMSDSENPVQYISPTAIAEFLNGANKIFENGTIEFGENWEFNSNDNYHYFVASGTTSIASRLFEISYDESLTSQQEIYLFNGDTLNSNLITCEIIDGEPIEELPVKSMKIEVFIEAIQYSSISNWNIA